MNIFVLLCPLLLFSRPLEAKEVSISASVDKQVVTLNGQIVLRIEVRGSRITGDPELPSLPNFSVYSSGRTQNISVTPRKITSTIVYTYALVPRFVGKTSIGPIRLRHKGLVYTTQPIPIEVRRPASAPPAAPRPSPPRPAQVQEPEAPAGTAPPVPQVQEPEAPAPPDIFATAAVDKKKAYVNEQVTLTVRFHTSVRLLGNPEYVPPRTQGFLSEDLPPLRNSETVYKGRHYYYTEIKTALFPVHPGKGNISPATIRCQVQEDSAMDPFSPNFFQKFFSRGLLGRQTREIHTDSISVKILPLPKEGRPQDFSGAVGKVSISASLDKSDLAVGEAATLTVTVKGKGNLKTASAPEVPEIPSLRTYEPVSSLTTTKTRDVVHSVRMFKTVLVPKVSGRLTIPSIKYNYFNPHSGLYASISTKPLELNVKPGAAQAPPQSYIARPDASRPAFLVPISEDIHYLKERPGEPFLHAFMRKLTGRRWIHFLPLTLFIFSLAFVRYQEWQAHDPALIKSRNALSRARKLVRMAEREFSRNNTNQAISLLSNSVAGYLSDKLDRPAMGIPFKKALEAFSEKFPRVRPKNVESLQGIWNRLEQLRYAPGGQKPEAPAPGAPEALFRLETDENKNVPLTIEIKGVLKALERDLKR